MKFESNFMSLDYGLQRGEMEQADNFDRQNILYA